MRSKAGRLVCVCPSQEEFPPLEPETSTAADEVDCPDSRIRLLRGTA